MRRLRLRVATPENVFLSVLARLKQQLHVVLTVSTALVASAFAHAQSPIPEGATPSLYVDGLQFTEGPYWTGDSLLVSDIFSSTIYEVTEGEAAVWLEPSGRANGIIEDAEGNIVAAQHDRAIARVTDDRTLVTLADRYEGRRLNSPNDLVLHSSGAIYFTDPAFGLSGPPFGAEGQTAELDIAGVYRLDSDGSVVLEAEDLGAPNGLAFSPDESRLYVNDTASQSLWVYQVTADGALTNGSLLYQFDSDEEGNADGLKVDPSGVIISTGPGGLHSISPEGDLIQSVRLPQVGTNVAFGGVEGRTLFVTAGTAVYTLPLTP